MIAEIAVWIAVGEVTFLCIIKVQPRLTMLSRLDLIEGVSLRGFYLRPSGSSSPYLFAMDEEESYLRPIGFIDQQRAS